ncbi:HAMP domain-containing histidine kinase [bacterium]|nr:HAMP domain-containing histidine kinase [bacterium]
MTIPHTNPLPPGDLKLSRVDRMLRSREARVLAWSLVARLAFLAIFITSLILHLLGWLSKGIVAETDKDAFGGLVLTLAAAIIIAFAWTMVRQEKQLVKVGLGAVMLDMLLIAALPLVWVNTINFPNGSPAFLMKNELFTLCIVGIVVNTISLRPLYPAIMATGMVFMHFIIMLFVMTDPRVELNWGFSEHFYSAAVNPGVFIIRILILILVGGFLSFLAWAARKNIRDAVALEVSNFEIREQQAQAIHEGKMAALSGLVAGVAHELNTPLGAVRSSVDTLEKGAVKLANETTADSEDSKKARLIELMNESGKVAVHALDRISSMLNSLKDFITLDEAEQQRTDLRAGLDTTLSLIQQETKGGVEIVREYGQVPEIQCRPKELNQVFMTLIVNAFEAMGGQGVLRIATSVSEDRLTVEIGDTGPGIPEEKRSGLFDIGFSAGKGRVRMGLGLPMAHRIVARHGGELSVESEIGQGTRFTILLPINGGIS